MNMSEVLKYTKQLDILYVEDEEVSQELYAAIFADLFLSVDVASDGIDALSQYIGKPYDIIISDICMPNMDGIELCETILNKNPNQSIIIMSAHNEVDKLDKIYKLGIKNVLAKPVNIDDLMKILGEISQLALEFKNS